MIGRGVHKLSGKSLENKKPGQQLFESKLGRLNSVDSKKPLEKEGGKLFQVLSV